MELVGSHERQSMIEQVIQWLRDGDEHGAAATLDQCELDLVWVDLVFELAGDREFELYDVSIAAPRQVLDGLEGSYQQQKEQIEGAIRALVSTNNRYVRSISWVPKPRLDRSRIDDDISEQLLTLDSEHVQRSWERALKRRSEDPEGAITAARSLVEAVCKHILDEERVSYPDDADLPKLYRLTVEQLRLAPEQYADSLVRKLLGSCQSVVGGVAALRNHLGDAHGKGAGAVVPHPLLAELAVNLAGTMAKYLLGVWDSSRRENDS
jgi:hypothetical protein